MHLRHTGKVFHILDLKIREMVNDLNLIVWATGNDFPKTRFIGKMPDFFYFQIGEMIHHLDFIIGKAAHELDAPVNF